MFMSRFKGEDEIINSMVVNTVRKKSDITSRVLKFQVLSGLDLRNPEYFAGHQLKYKSYEIVKEQS